MKFVRILCIALFSSFLAACATPQQASKLTAPTRSAEIEVKSKISYKRVGGAMSVAWEEGLAPGIYVAEKENDLGTFFRGPGRCVWLHNSLQPEFVTIRPGGIWLPRDPNVAPKLYFYLEAATYRVPNIDAYLVGKQSEQGSPVSTDVGGQFGSALVAASLESEKDTPNLNVEITDQVFIKLVKSGYRTR